MREKTVQNEILLAVGRGDTRLFRNNVGTGWQGNPPRPLRAGLCKGSSDLIGWRSIEITPDMVGQKVAVFLAIECKATKGGRVSVDQQRFIDAVQDAGGIAGVARNVEEAARIKNPGHF